MVSSVLFSSNSNEWETPQKLFDELANEFDFIHDLAASKENAKCTFYYTIEDNALSLRWHKLQERDWIGDSALWLNPPYSNIKDWVQKAYEENLKGAKIVMLIPARVDTRWFHAYIYHNPKVEIRFIKGRLKFSNSKNSAPFPSMVVVFR